MTENDAAPPEPTVALETPPGRSRRRTWAFRALIVLGVGAAALAVAHRPLLVGYAQLLRVDNPAPSDVLVLLNGQWTVRPLHAAKLYHEGLAPLVLVGRTPPIPYPDLCDSSMNRAALVRAGVPETAIVMLDGGAKSTRDEAILVRDYLRSHPAKRITIVTQAFHAARSRWIFRKVLAGAGVDVRVASADDPRYDDSNWYRHPVIRSYYIVELFKILWYQIRY